MQKCEFELDVIYYLFIVVDSDKPFRALFGRNWFDVLFPEYRRKEFNQSGKNVGQI